MESKKPLVSVYMITYNHEKFIEEAIQSILMQDVDFDYEIVIGDDASKDNTQSILREIQAKYKEKIKLILRDKNVGPTHNAYDVFTACSGKYIAILEGDDYWLDKNKLKTQVDFLEKHDEYIGTCHMVQIRENNKIIGLVPNKENLKDEYSLNDFLDEKIFATQSLVFKNFFKESENIKEIERLLTCNPFVGDFQLCCLILQLGKVKLINREMSVYRFVVKEGSENYNSLRKTIDKCNDHIALLNNVNKYFNMNYNEKISKIKYRYLETKLRTLLKNKELNKFAKSYAVELSKYEKIKFTYRIAKKAVRHN